MTICMTVRMTVCMAASSHSFNINLYDYFLL